MSKKPAQSKVQVYLSEKEVDEFRDETMVEFRARLKGGKSSLSRWFREQVEMEMGLRKREVVSSSDDPAQVKFEEETRPHLDKLLEERGYTFEEWVRWSATKALVDAAEAKRLAKVRERRPLRAVPVAGSFTDLSAPG